MKIRLNRYLAECGIASRRKSEEYIKEGRIDVNGKTVVDITFTIDAEKDIIHFDGERIKQQKKVYFLLNKPKGFITSTEDEKGRKTVLDLIDTKQKIFPVGRLDYDTTGVLLLTNDGDFANFFTHPGNNIPREYKALLNRPLEEVDKMKLLRGITLDRKKSRFEEVRFAGKNAHEIVFVKTVEGRNHFVKNMFAALGYFVNKLERVSFGGLQVKGIPKGSYVKLSYEEIKRIYDIYSR
ncbi:MAG: pseudouridine synthase [Bacteroidota bacterium]